MIFSDKESFKKKSSLLLKMSHKISVKYIITNAPETTAVNHHTLAGLLLTSTQKGKVGDM